MGEYLGRLFLESKARPIYIVDRVYERGSATSSGENQSVSE
jgi:hypothetical protein